MGNGRTQAAKITLENMNFFINCCES